MKSVDYHHRLEVTYMALICSVIKCKGHYHRLEVTHLLNMHEYDPEKCMDYYHLR